MSQKITKTSRGAPEPTSYEVPPPPPVQEAEEPVEGSIHIDVEEISDEHEADRVLPIAMRRSLREEARSVRHLCTHLPKNPYCEDCCRGKMKHAPKYSHGTNM